MLKNGKGSDILRIIGGGYLAYIGTRLLVEVSRAKPANASFLLFMGGIFVLIGVGFACMALYHLYRSFKGGKKENGGTDISSSPEPVSFISGDRNGESGNDFEGKENRPDIPDINIRDHQPASDISEPESETNTISNGEQSDKKQEDDVRENSEDIGQ